MKKFYFATFLVLLAASWTSAASIVPVKPKLADGCYQIGNAQELYGFASIVNGTDGMERDTSACGKLTANIVVNENVLPADVQKAEDDLKDNVSGFIPWTPIYHFGGTFDGQFHTISGLYYSSRDEEYVGLFSLIENYQNQESPVVIKNLGLVDSYFFGRQYAGGFIAQSNNSNAIVENVYSRVMANSMYGRGYKAGIVANSDFYGHLDVYNSFYLPPEGVTDVGAISGYSFNKSVYTVGTQYYKDGKNYTLNRENFSDGTVAAMLRNSFEESVWGQDVGVDPYPVYNKALTNYDGAVKISKLDMYGYESDEKASYSYVEGLARDLPKPSREGYIFYGWFRSPDFSGDFVRDITQDDTGDKTFYGRWVKIPEMVDGCSLIGSADELFAFARIVSQLAYSKDTLLCGKLTSDIDIQEKSSSKSVSWEPIIGFKGTFDGNGHTISGLYIYRGEYSSDGSNLGLFSTINGTADKHSVVKNLGVLESQIKGNSCLGNIAGSASNTDFLNVYSDNFASTHNESSYAGGLVGCQHDDVSVVESYCIFPEGYIPPMKEEKGGLVGHSYDNLKIINSFAVFRSQMGEIHTNRPFGGLVGTVEGNAEIINSYAKAFYGGFITRGGLVGNYADTAQITTDNSFFYDNLYDNNRYTVSQEQFANGALAFKLREYKKDGIDGSVWGQVVGIDSFPRLTGRIYSDAEQTIEPAIPAKSKDGCYQIGTDKELYGFALIANGSDFEEQPVCGELVADIVLNKNVLDSDGKLKNSGKGLKRWNPIERFNGTFDGKGHTISGMFIDDENASYAGLFGSVYSDDSLVTVVKNIGLVDFYISGESHVGAIVGAQDSTMIISNSYARGVASTSSGCVGGLVGTSGIGYLKIEKSYNDSHVESDYSGVGGLVGCEYSQYGTSLVEINESYNSGTLAGNSNMSGGLIGRLQARTSFSIRNSYNVGHLVNGGNGFVGYAENKLYKNFIENSFSYVDDPSLLEKNSGLVSNPYGSVWVEIKNVYSNKVGVRDSGAIVVDEEMFRNGSVAYALHEYRSDSVNGNVWGQNVGTDLYPTLSGKVQNSASSIYSNLRLVTYEGDTVAYAQKYPVGVGLALPIPVRKGYVFKGWHDNPQFTGTAVERVGTDASGDLTFYAKWWHYPEMVNNCYELGDEGELYLFASMVNADTVGYGVSERSRSVCAKLTADIVVNKNVLVDGNINAQDSANFLQWTPINEFIGVFDGQGHTISGLFSTGAHYNDYGNLEYNYVGLFSSIREKSVIKNLGIVDYYFDGLAYNGAFVGIVEYSDFLMENCFGDGYVYSSGGYGGGLIGVIYRSNAMVLESFNKGTVSGSRYMGGLVAYSEKSHVTIAGSSNYGNINGFAGIGGILGYGESKVNTEITYSFNEGDINGNSEAGGIVGRSDDTLHLWNVYNLGNVSSNKYAGGLAGSANVLYVTAENSYNMGTSKVEDPDGVSDDLFGVYGEEKSKYLNLYYRYSAIPDFGIAGTEREFADGTIAKALHDYKNGSVDGSGWTQVENIDHPVFDKDVVATYIQGLNRVEIDESKFEALPHSSSNVTPNSSSSAGSSSSKTESSSSKKDSSSSKANSSSSKKDSSGSKTNSSSSKKDSSSSKANSSSSKKDSSSSKANSSSSKKDSSSSKANSSSSKKDSSSSKANSSSSKKDSSSSKANSSSSKKQQGLVTVYSVPQFKVSAAKRSLQIEGAEKGATFALFDMQGRILEVGKVRNADFRLNVPRSGNYLIRIADQARFVSVK